MVPLIVAGPLVGIATAIGLTVYRGWTQHAWAYVLLELSEPGWFTFGTTVAWPLLLVGPYAVRRNWRSRHGRCLRCGYRLGPDGLAPRCSECGRQSNRDK